MVQVPYQPFPGEQPSYEIGKQQISGINPNAFGAGVGQALQQVAETVGRGTGEVVELYARTRQASQQSDWETARIRWEDSLEQRRLLQNQEGQNTNADNMYSNFNTTMIQEANELLSRIPAGPQRDQMRVRIEQTMSRFRPLVLQDELQLRNANAARNWQIASDALMRRIDADPAQLSSAIEEGERLIRESPFPPSTQEDRIRVWREQANMAAARRIVQTNPEQAAATLGGETDYERQMRAVESGNRANARNPRSSATGFYQFIQSTWNEIANSPEGRAAGLRPVGGMRPALGRRRGGPNTERLAPYMDPSRRGTQHQTQLNDDFARRFADMMEAAPPEVRDAVRIRSGARTVEEQRAIWARTLAEQGGNVRQARRWAAPPGRSNHNHGEAMDLQYDGAATPTTERGRRAMQWVHANAQRFGLNFRLGNEPWHIESIDAGRRSGDPREDPAQQAAAFRIFTQRSGQTLTQENLPITGRNLRVLHFLGNTPGGGGVQFLRTLQSNPGANAAELFPDAARANPEVFYTDGAGRTGPRTVGQVFQHITRGFTDQNPLADPRMAQVFAGLNYNDRRAVEQQAEVNSQRRAQEYLRAQSQRVNEAVNTLEAGIVEGSIGRLQIQQAWNNGVFTDGGTLSRLLASVDRRDEELLRARRYDEALQSGAGLNPHSTSDRQLAEAAYNRLLRANGGNALGAGMQVYAESGVMPQAAADRLLQMAQSTDTRAIMQAATAMLQIAQNPRTTAPFAGMHNQEQLERFANDVRYLNDTNTDNQQGNVQRIAQRLADRNAQRQRGSVNIQQAQEFARRLRETRAPEVANMIRSWMDRLPGGPQFIPGQQNVAITDFIRFAEQAYLETNDEGEALNRAQFEMGQLYGNSNGWLVRMPIERIMPLATYPDGRQSHDYIYDQALEFARARTGRDDLQRSDLMLLPLPGGQTASGWRARDPNTPYMIMYQYRNANGHTVTDVVRVEGSQLAAGFTPRPEEVLRNQWTGELEEPPFVRNERDRDLADRILYARDNDLEVRIDSNELRRPTQEEIEWAEGINARARRENEPYRRISNARPRREADQPGTWATEPDAWDGGEPEGARTTGGSF